MLWIKCTNKQSNIYKKCRGPHSDTFTHLEGFVNVEQIAVLLYHENIYRAGSRLVPSQETLVCNNVSHWLGANLESALYLVQNNIANNTAMINVEIRSDIKLWLNFVVPNISL